MLHALIRGGKKEKDAAWFWKSKVGFRVLACCVLRQDFLSRA